MAREVSVGTFRVAVQIGSLAGLRFQELELLVDTGSTHTLIPRPLLERLGVRPVRQVRFQLADERAVSYEVGPATMRIGDIQLPVLVVFGPPDAEPLMGATTLEIFNLAADPVGQRLVEVDGLLKAVQRVQAPAKTGA